MEITGRVQGGVVVLQQGASLPEGAFVAVVYPAPRPPKPPAAKRRIELPLVHSDRPGSVDLSGPKIAEILDAEDAAPRR
jgi:hypothetical protein